MFGFKECAMCASKPGSPALCEACSWNRWLIARYEAMLSHYRVADRARLAMEKRIELASKD